MHIGGDVQATLDAILDEQRKAAALHHHQVGMSIHGHMPHFGGLGGHHGHDLHGDSAAGRAWAGTTSAWAASAAAAAATTGCSARRAGTASPRMTRQSYLHATTGLNSTLSLTRRRRRRVA